MTDNRRPTIAIDMHPAERVTLAIVSRRVCHEMRESREVIRELVERWPAAGPADTVVRETLWRCRTMETMGDRRN